MIAREGQDRSQRKLQVGGSVRPVVLLAMVAAVGLGVALFWGASRTTEVPTAPPAGTEPAPEAVPEVAPSRPVSPSPGVSSGAGARTAPAGVAASLDAMTPTAETVRAEGAINRLTQLNLSDGNLSREQMDEITGQLSQVVAQGRAAVPAIRDFLGKNLDVAFTKQSGLTSPSGSPVPTSLRLGLIDALAKIGGPESVAVASETLQKAAVPGEIAGLTRALEIHAPGEYRDIAVAAARDALSTALKNPGADADIGPVFQVLQTYGDAGLVNDFANAGQQYRYYSMIAIAGLPDEQGVATLMQMATDPNGQAAGTRQLATQLLAQSAAQNAEARNTLIAQAKQGEIYNWAEVAQALSGARLQYGQDWLAQDPSTAPKPRSSQYHHVVFGNQSFRTIHPEMTPDQVQAHVGLIDQVMAVTTDQVGRDALQRARNRLVPPPAE